MALHLAPQFRPRPEEMGAQVSADEFDAQGFPSEDVDSEILLPDGAFQNEDYAYEAEASAQAYQDDARGYQDEAGYYGPSSQGGGAPSPYEDPNVYQDYGPGSTPYYGGGGGGGGGMPYYPPAPAYQPPLPTSTPAEVTTFVTALQACQATQEQASAAVSALTAIGMSAAAATIVTMYQGQAARCAQQPPVTPPPQEKQGDKQREKFEDRLKRPGLTPSGTKPRSGLTLPPVKSSPKSDPMPPKSAPPGSGSGPRIVSARAGGGTSIPFRPLRPTKRPRPAAPRRP